MAATLSAGGVAAAAAACMQCGDFRPAFGGVLRVPLFRDAHCPSVCLRPCVPVAWISPPRTPLSPSLLLSRRKRDRRRRRAQRPGRRTLGLGAGGGGGIRGGRGSGGRQGIPCLNAGVGGSRRVLTWKWFVSFEFLVHFRVGFVLRRGRREMEQMRVVFEQSGREVEIGHRTNAGLVFESMRHLRCNCGAICVGISSSKQRLN